MQPMDIDTFAGKIVNAIRLPNKIGFYIEFDEKLLKWKYVPEENDSYFLRSSNINNLKTTN